VQPEKAEQLMELAYDRFGEGFPLIILHGLFGSASNFRSFARKFSETYSVFCLDLRNHGASPHHEDTSYSAMSGDVVEFMDRVGLERAHILGHSLGGKVAMQLALSHPERLGKLIVGDIAPVPYPPHHTRIFEGLNAIDLDRLTSRGDAEEALQPYVPEAGIRLFLLTNLVRTKDGGFAWRCNLEALEKGYDHIAAAPAGGSFRGETLFLRGEKSDYIRDEHLAEIHRLFPRSQITTIAGAGHWLHADKPEEFMKTVLAFLKEA
tara:strand:- start:7076 stop:7867 length:792 start_codon:yes stop_codon:yes gene_type:complete